jgi:long-subunit fatty acid transport protein
VGTNYNDKLYLGASIGVTRVDFFQEIGHTEEDVNSSVPDLDNFYYYYRLSTRGTGFTFKLGATYRPVEFLRIGAAVHIPTFFKMEDDYYSYMESSFDTPRDTTGRLSYASESPNGYYEYSLNTPFRFIGGVAFQVKKFAVISVDYEYIDYSSARLKDGSDGYNFNGENNIIQDAFKSTSNVRVGAEFKLGMFQLRGGFAHYGKPYVAGEMNKDSNYSFITGGVGLRTRSFFVDLGYQYGLHEEKYLMYNMTELEETSLKSNPSKVMLTFGYRF